MPDWTTFRERMPIAARWAYLDHAAVAPLSGPAAEAIGRWLREAAEQGDTVWDRWARRVEQVRLTAASLLGAAAEEIALVANTTAGIGMVAEGYPWQDGDNVVTLANEFPSNVYPWMNLASRGVQLRRVAVGQGGAVEPARIAEAIDERTRILAVSWVGYASGWRIDVDQLVELAHRRGVLVLLDAIQALGVFPLDVGRTQVDFLAADGHKWLLGPEGAGVLYVRREHLDRLRPLGVGWHSVPHAHDFNRIEFSLRPEAARYEGGSQNMAGVLGLGASLELLVEYGLGPAATALQERVLELVELAAERLGGLGARFDPLPARRHRSGILSFELPGRDPAQLRRRCLERGVALSSRGGRLRISPHVYVNEDDLDRLAHALQDSPQGTAGR